ncbi:MAG: hypothetical protein JWL82_57 [Parcubacteria group bacterium]|nr:hypothetical protein [Parcubacteria group bacterium]
MNVTDSYNAILSSVEFDEFTPEEQETFLRDLNSLVFRGAVLRTIERMDEGTRDDWYRFLAQNPSQEKIRLFLERRVPGADLAIAETVESLAGDILAVTTY